METISSDLSSLPIRVLIKNFLLNKHLSEQKRNEIIKFISENYSLNPCFKLQESLKDLEKMGPNISEMEAKKGRFDNMSLEDIFKEVIIAKETWSSQKQEAMDYICKKYSKTLKSRLF